MQRMWTATSLPPHLQTARLTPLYKKGDKRDAGNYRPISICDALAKLYALVVNERLSQAVVELGLLPREQAGFRRREEGVAQIAALQTVVTQRAKVQTWRQRPSHSTSNQLMTQCRTAVSSQRCPTSVSPLPSSRESSLCTRPARASPSLTVTNKCAQQS